MIAPVEDSISLNLDLKVNDYVNLAMVNNPTSPDNFNNL